MTLLDCKGSVGIIGAGSRIRCLAALLFVSSLVICLPPRAEALYSSNLLKNTDFEQVRSDRVGAARWSYQNLDAKADTTSLLYKRFNNRSFHISGAPGENKAVGQEIAVSGAAGDVIELSGWSKSHGSLNSSGHYGLNIGIHYNDGTWKWVTRMFDYEQHPFAFLEVEAEAAKPFNFVRVSGLFFNQPSGSHAWFDGMRVNKNPGFPTLFYRLSGGEAELQTAERLDPTFIIEPYIESRSLTDIKSWLRRLPNDAQAMFPLSSKGSGSESDVHFYLWLKGNDGYYRFNYGRAAYLINEFDDDRHVASWYLYDEPIYGQVTGNELMNAYEYVKRLTDKPVGVAYSEGDEFARFGGAAKHADFVLFSFYPYRNGEAFHYGDTTDHCRIEREWREMAKVVSGKPWYGVVQAFGRDGFGYYAPTAEQITAQAREYKSLGAGGIAYYSYSSDAFGSDPYQHIADRWDWQEAVRLSGLEWQIDKPL